MVRPFHVHFVNLDPTAGSEMKKQRRCLVLSPPDMNAVLGTAIIAPLTTTLRGYPSRIEIRFENKFCEICLDQLRAVDETRIQGQTRGRISTADIEKVKNGLMEMFELKAVH
jgi:mRNA interferase MazF